MATQSKTTRQRKIVLLDDSCGQTQQEKIEIFLRLMSHHLKHIALLKN